MESYDLLKSTVSLLLIIFLCFFLAQASHGAAAPVLFSSLPPTLILTASPNQAQVLNAGEDTIALTWGLNQSYAADTVDDSYREFKVKLCFAPISQLDRGWRKTLDDLSKDKTCQFTIFEGAYQRNQSFKWRIETDVPTAVYFVRAYAFNSAGEEVAYGQTTDAKKRDRLFEIKAISGRHLSLDVASGCLSAFSLVSLVGFYMLEKNRTKSYVLQRTNI